METSTLNITLALAARICHLAWLTFMYPKADRCFLIYNSRYSFILGHVRKVCSSFSCNICKEILIFERKILLDLKMMNPLSLEGMTQLHNGIYLCNLVGDAKIPLISQMQYIHQF